MNYLTQVLSTQQDIDLVIKKNNVISNYQSSIERNKTILFRFLMMSCLVLSFMPKSSMASSSASFPLSLFCKYNCSRFVSVPSSFGAALGGYTSGWVGAGLCVPIGIIEIPIEIFEPRLHFGLEKMCAPGVTAKAGAQVASHIFAFPFWVTETLVYDVPVKIINLVQHH